MGDVILLEEAKRRRQGFAPMRPDEVELKAWQHDKGRAMVRLVVGEDMEELIVPAALLRQWGQKFLAVADQIDGGERFAVV